MTGPRHQKLIDASAIGLSVICIIHCLAVPIAVIVFPVLGLSIFVHGLVHLWLFAGAAVLSAIAFTGGYRRHNGRAMIGLGVAGLTLMLMGAVHLMAEPFEEVFTLIGVCLVSAAHLNNWYRHMHLSRCARSSTAPLSEPIS